MENNNLTVFISYTSDGVDEVTKLKKLLGENNIDCWEFREQMFAGDVETKYIKEIDGVHFFVPVISPTYKEREATMIELQRALSIHIKRKKNNSEFNFILPLGNRENRPDEIGHFYCSKDASGILQAIKQNQKKMKNYETPYSFSEWPYNFVDDDCNLNAMLIVGHSGKESEPTMEDIKRIMPDLDIENTGRPQSHRIVERVPELVKTLDDATNKIRTNKGFKHSTSLGGKFSCHVDWHAIRFHFEELKNRNIIAFGAGDTNLVSRWVLSYYNEHLPIRFDSAHGSQTIYCDSIGELNSLTIDQVDSNDDKYVGVLLMLPNPLNPLKKVVIVAGLTALGTQAGIMALTENREELRTPGGFGGNHIRIVKGIEKDWRAIDYTFLR